MAIRREQPGAAKAAATAGTAIGKAQRAEEDRARVEREQARANAEATQRKARQTAMDWELQKMQMRSQQDFQQEQTEKQWDYERFNRAKAWDIEKMELRSRMDFEQEEQERVREMSRIDAKILALKKAEEDKQFTGREPEFKSLMFSLEQQKLGIKNPRALPRPEEQRDIPKRTDIDAAVKFLQEYEEKTTKAKKLLHPFAPEPTKEEDVAAQYYRSIIDQIPGGTISSGLPTPKTEQEYAAIPVGSQYIDSSGNTRTKR